MASLTPIWTIRGLSTPATPTYLNTRSSTSRRRASWITTSLPPSISGQNAEACGCRAGSGSKVNSKSWLVR
jgi:hypothetical protein